MTDPIPENEGVYGWSIDLSVVNSLQDRLKAVDRDRERREVECGKLRAKVRELEQALCMIYDKYEDGPPRTENGDPDGSALGNAVSLSFEEEQQILRLIPSERTVLHGSDKAVKNG